MAVVMVMIAEFAVVVKMMLRVFALSGKILVFSIGKPGLNDDDGDGSDGYDDGDVVGADYSVINFSKTPL